MKKLTVKELLWVTSGVFYGNPCVLEQEIVNHAYMLNQLKMGGAYYIYQDDTETAMISIKSAHKKGAIVCITDKEVTEKNVGAVIKVDNMLEATKAIGRYARQYVDIPVIAVTGSVGKTSTKDMIVSVLSQKYKVTRTSPYWNSNYRIAFCILNIESDDEVIVIESAVGNMRDNVENGKIIRPDFVVMTNIGDSHMDAFKTKNNILEAKRKLLNHMAPTGYAFINFNDSYLKTISLKTPKTVVKVGYEKDYNIYATDIVDNGLEGTQCIIRDGNESMNVSIPVPGVHFVDCALFAYGVGSKLDISIDKIKRGIESFQTSDHRCKVIEANGITILEDCYNISPKSSKSALDIISKCNGRKCVIFGAMNRLGEQSENFHREIGKYIYEKKIDIVIGIGNDTKYMLDELEKMNHASERFYLESKEYIYELLPNVLQKEDFVLIKGALPDHFSEITDYILKQNFR